MKIQKSKPTIIDSGTMADLFKDFEFFAVKNPFVFNDGGRAEAGFKGSTGDCVTRAIAIAMRLPYKQVYKELTEAIKTFSETKRCKVAKKIKKEKDYSPRDGVYKKVYHDYILSKGWKWKTCMTIGSGTTVHLNASELPKGNIITRLSKHLCAVIDGIINDTFNPSREGTRCVYGYYYDPKEEK